MKPRVCILRTDGTNCDRETAHAFTLAGGSPDFVHVNELRSGRKRLEDYQILAIPGGFSYGDDIASGKVLAVELISYLRDQFAGFIEAGKLVIGICNGFQVLMRTGALPFLSIGDMYATLAPNSSGKFECRWVEMVVGESPCIFTRSLTGMAITLPVAHGEGKFFAGADAIEALWTDSDETLAPLLYSKNGGTTYRYPANPNGSALNIAGVCNATGRVFGLMPHPERFVERTQYPNWRREYVRPWGLAMFEDAIRTAAEL